MRVEQFRYYVTWDYFSVHKARSVANADFGCRQAVIYVNGLTRGWVRTVRSRGEPLFVQ